MIRAGSVFLAVLLAAHGLFADDKASNPTKARALYDTNCGTCHQPTGDGVPFLQPALWESPRANGPKGAVIDIILWGSAVVPAGTSEFENEMPGFAGQLSDEEVASLASYVRTQFDNRGGPVDAALVRKRRQAHQSRTPSGS